VGEQASVSAAQPAAVRDKELKQSQVLHVGKIVQDIMYGDSNTLSWMEEGKGRVLTLVWATAFFGGDTVPSVAGYTPKAGGAAMALMDERVGALIYETGMESSASLLRAAQQLLKAAVYSKHKTWFDVGVTRPASWVAETSLQDMADTVYEKCQDQPTNWMLSEDQIRVQSLKTNSRVREWATSWTAEPRIVFGPRDSLSGCWQRDPNQLKGLFAVDADGKVVGAAITRKNVAPEYGLGWDISEMARRVYGDSDAAASAISAPTLLSNDYVRATSREALLKLPVACLDLNVKRRSTLVRGKWLPVGLGQGRPGKATNLIELVRRGVEPAADAAQAASDARPPGATPAPGRAGGAAAASPATQVAAPAAAAGPARAGLRRRRAATPQATPTPRGRTPRRTSKRSKSSHTKAS
jgi:hypothetical protein